ncbi:MAG TPA: ABC transporter permease [Anaerohalosphaeraceae bacterium]|nr:ABC transporter permease [Anaerohalosphaeraceae bacterium]
MKNFLLGPILFLRLFAQSILLAIGQIWVNKTRSLLTTLGIIIGVASVTAVVAGMSGMNAMIMENFEFFGTKKIFLWPERPQSGSQKNANRWDIRFRPEQFEGVLEHCPSVEYLTLMSQLGTMTARYKDHTAENVRVTGVEESWFKIENRPVSRGRTFSYLDARQARRVCVIPQKLQEKLYLDRDCIGQTLQLDYHTFLIIGIVEERPRAFFEWQGDRIEVFIPFQTAQAIQESWIEAMASCRRTDLAEEAKAELTFFLRKMRKIKPGEPNNFGVFFMESEVQKVRSMMAVLSLVAAAIVSISLVVGGIGIMNIMLVSVSERTREIGLRKAVGAPASAILMQFLVEAVVLCLLGGMLGLGLGHILAKGISHSAGFLSKAEVPGWAVLLAVGFSTTVGIFFGMFPAVKAARLDPIEALRHE